MWMLLRGLSLRFRSGSQCGRRCLFDGWSALLQAELQRSQCGRCREFSQGIHGEKRKLLSFFSIGPSPIRQQAGPIRNGFIAACRAHRMKDVPTLGRWTVSELLSGHQRLPDRVRRCIVAREQQLERCKPYTFIRVIEEWNQLDSVAIWSKHADRPNDFPTYTGIRIANDLLNGFRMLRVVPSRNNAEQGTNKRRTPVRKRFDQLVRRILRHRG